MVPMPVLINFYFVLLILGLFLGCSIALLVAIVLKIEAHNLMDKEEDTQYMENLFPLYT